MEKKTSVQITSGPYDDEQPAWSPDGKTIAFVSNRTAEPDTNRDSNIFLIAPVAGETPKAITTNPSEDNGPRGRPMGRPSSTWPGERSRTCGTDPPMFPP